jgi:sugar phosphate permease
MARFEPPNLLVMGGLLLGNFYYSVAKKSLPVAIPQLQDKLSASTKDLGSFSSAFSISYGVGKVLGGVMSDLASPYVLYVVGLYLAAFVNLAIVFTKTVPSMSTMWALNAFVQGVGGPALSRLVVDISPPKTRTSNWSNLTFVSVSAIRSCIISLFTLFR